MLLTPRLLEAINLSSRLHHNQKRKDPECNPYVSHTYGVMHILSKITEDEEILIAGLMHDSLEDVPGYTKENLLADCGARVLSLVEGVTEPLNANKRVDEQLPWLVRKESYLKTLALASNDSVIISSADKLHNLMCVKSGLENRKSLDENVYGASTSHILFYEKVFTLANERLSENHVLVREFRSILDSIKFLLEKLKKHDQNKLK